MSDVNTNLFNEQNISMRIDLNCIIIVSKVLNYLARNTPIFLLKV